MDKKKARISSYLSTLDHFGKMGKIHSVFKQSLNLMVNEHLINLSASGNFLSSFGVQLSPPVFQEIRPFCQQGNVVRLTQQSLVIYSQVGIKRLSFSDIQIVPLNIGAIETNMVTVMMLKEILTTKQLEKRLGLPGGNRERMYFDFLQNPEMDDEKWLALVEYFVGRGKGLTPSGDDLLMGYLFILKLYQHKCYQVLELQLHKMNRFTTDVSWNYLSALLLGYVSSPFIELRNGLEEELPYNELNQLVEAILAIGHTSGSDSCYGLLLGVKALMENK
ncbi:DUF2877 domain-containing protein [Enterococcus sp. DIV0800]|uniref:DUF2877 domain-containing protein n=1 Tax=unclassified Enterococcus TaxID=2608891 RepID=UPI003D2F9F76